MDTSAVLERATELVRCCKVPRLITSIDEGPLERTTFEPFLHVLDATLPQLFDVLAEHGALLLGYDQYNGDGNVPFKAELALVIIEQFSPTYETDVFGEEYRTVRPALRERIAHFFGHAELEHLLTDKGSDRVRRHLLEHYRRVLSETEWKHHPADVAGFVRLIEYLYGHYILLSNPQLQLEDDLAAYILSVGIMLVEFFDPTYQRLGLRLFCVLLSHRHRSVMRRTNIHRVVYSNAKKLTNKCNQEELFLEALWKCIFLYVEVEEVDRTDFTEWNTVDDIMEILLNGLMFQSNLKLSSIYLITLLKMLALDLPNFFIDGFDEVQCIEAKCHLYEPVCESLRQDCLGGFHNRRYYRWLHQLIELLPHEAVKCQGESRENGRYCHGVNLLFILVTFPVEPDALQPPHIGMQTSLMEFINVFKQYEKQQCTVMARRSSATSDLVYNTKALVSISKTMQIFLTNLAPRYFPDHPEMAALGQQLANVYADCDSIMYNCMQRLMEKFLY